MSRCGRLRDTGGGRLPEGRPQGAKILAIAGGCSIVLIYAQMHPQTPNALFKNAANNFKRLKCSHRKFRVVSPAV